MSTCSGVQEVDAPPSVGGELLTKADLGLTCCTLDGEAIARGPLTGSGADLFPTPTRHAAL